MEHSWFRSIPSPKLGCLTETGANHTRINIPALQLSHTPPPVWCWPLARAGAPAPPVCLNLAPHDGSDPFNLS